MRGWGLLWVVLMLTAVPGRAEQIVSGLSQSQVAITASFDGTAILIYGAAMRDAPPPSWPLLQVIITVEGPVVPIIVRQKARVAGIWINQGAMAIRNAPSFYAVMSTGVLADILLPEEDREYRVSIPMEIGAVGTGKVGTGAGETGAGETGAVRAGAVRAGEVGTGAVGTGEGGAVAAK